MPRISKNRQRIFQATKEKAREHDCTSTEDISRRATERHCGSRLMSSVEVHV